MEGTKPAPSLVGVPTSPQNDGKMRLTLANIVVVVVSYCCWSRCRSVMMMNDTKSYPVGI